MKLFKRIIFVLLSIGLFGLVVAFLALTFYKKELTQEVIQELRKKYGLTLVVDEVNVSILSNWPHTSVQLKRVTVSSERIKKNTEPFLKAGSLSVSFNLIKMLQGQFVVKYLSLKDVDLTLLKYADGTNNFKIKKGLDTLQSQSELSLNLNEIILKNVKFRFINEARSQNVGIHFINTTVLLKNYEEGIVADLQGELFINGLLFNPRAGEFLSDTKVNIQLQGAYYNKQKSICIYPPSFVVIDKHNYNVSSIIDFSETKKLSLTLESKNVKSKEIEKHLNPKIKKVLSQFKMKQTVDAKFLLVARLGIREEPIIIADITGKDCDLKIGDSKIIYSNLYFKGRILSLHQSRRKGDMDHAKITFESVKGKINDFPFTAEVKVLDLPTPAIDVLASIVLDGKNMKPDVTRQMIIKGTGLASIRYHGDARNLSKEKFLSESMNLNAYLVFTNLSYKKLGSDMEYVFNGKASLDRQNLSFENLRVKTTFGDMIIKGKAEQFLQYLLGMTNVLKAKMDAVSQVIDLNLLYKNSVSEKAPKKSYGTSDLMKRSIFDIDFKLRTSKLRFRKIETRNAEVGLNYKKNLISISRLHLHVCDGEIDVNGHVKEMQKIYTNVSIKNVDATQLFEQFENFGQEAVKSENIKGKIYLEGNFAAELDREKKFIGETVASDISVKVKDGHLINFEPLQKISSFALKQEEVKDVSFSELNETLKIRGFEIRIDELEIASSILNLYVVDGLYSIKGNSNINMLIPWSNLKRLGSNSIPKISGQSAQNTKGLKLNYSGPPKKMKLTFGHKEQEKRFW